MLSTKNPFLLKFCSNHVINLVTPEDLPDLEAHLGTEFGKLMYALRLGHGKKEKLLDLQQKEAFSSVEPETVRVLNTLLKTRIPIPGKKEGGTADMFRAIQEIRDEISGYRKAIAEKDSALAEKDSELAEKDSALAEKDSALAEKDSTIAEQSAEILRLRKLLAANAIN